jgi:hypothetical protein
MDIYEKVLPKLGTLKNEFLIFCVIASIIIFSNATSTNVEHTHRKEYIAIAFLVVGAIFYLFAWIRLPQSTAELHFAQGVLKETKNHRKKLDDKERSSGRE